MVRRPWFGPALALVCVLVDVVLAWLPWTVPSGAALDWTGHLATSALALLAARRLGAALSQQTAIVVLATSVLIDLDHLPMYAGLPYAAAGGRPPTHSLLLVVALCVAARIVNSRWPLVVAAGVLLHFLRDVATGGGLPLVWPGEVAVHAPYSFYLAALVLLAALAALPDRRRPGR